jgi:hypothetical protein
MTDDAPLETLERTLRWMEHADGRVRLALGLGALAGAYLAGWVLRARGWVDSGITVFFVFGALFCLYEPYFVGGVIDRCVKDYRAGTVTPLRGKGRWLLRASFRTGKHGVLNASLLLGGATFTTVVATRYFLARRAGEAIANVLIVVADLGVAATVLLCRRFYRFYAPVVAQAEGPSRGDARG